MTAMLSKGDERRHLIRRWLREDRTTRTIEEIQRFLRCSALHVTVDTIQRDLRRLEAGGSVRRIPHPTAGHIWGSGRRILYNGWTSAEN